MSEIDAAGDEVQEPCGGGEFGGEFYDSSPRPGTRSSRYIDIAGTLWWRGRHGAIGLCGPIVGQGRFGEPLDHPIRDIDQAASS
ncbi:MAG: hypothetical protein AAGC55_13230, partial [Myxococcota bacterium]